MHLFTVGSGNPLIAHNKKANKVWTLIYTKKEKYN